MIEPVVKEKKLPEPFDPYLPKPTAISFKYKFSTTSQLTIKFN